MINKDLEMKFHNGSMNESERAIFYKNMTQQEMFDFSDKVCNVISEKSYSSICMGAEAERKVMMDWRKYNN